MKTLTKTATFGEKKFKIAINREIAVKTFDEFPQEVDFLIKTYQGKGKDSLSETLEKGFFSKALSERDEITKSVIEIAEYALPKMLEFAEDKSDANEILDYLKKNNAIFVASTILFEFLAQGFTLDEPVQPKIKLVLK